MTTGLLQIQFFPHQHGVSFDCVEMEAHSKEVLYITKLARFKNYFLEFPMLVSIPFMNRY